MQQKKNSGCGLIAFPVIKAASNGDTEAIRMVLKHYEAYISYLSMRWFYDENGMPRCYVDDEKREMLEIQLITKILDNGGMCFPPFHTTEYIFCPIPVIKYILIADIG